MTRVLLRNQICSDVLIQISIKFLSQEPPEMNVQLPFRRQNLARRANSIFFFLFTVEDESEEESRIIPVPGHHPSSEAQVNILVDVLNRGTGPVSPRITILNAWLQPRAHIWLTHVGSAGGHEDGEVRQVVAGAGGGVGAHVHGAAAPSGPAALQAVSLVLPESTLDGVVLGVHGLRRRRGKKKVGMLIRGRQCVVFCDALRIRAPTDGADEKQSGLMGQKPRF